MGFVTRAIQVSPMRPDDCQPVSDMLMVVQDDDFTEEGQILRDLADTDGAGEVEATIELPAAADPPPDLAGRFVAHLADARTCVFGYISGACGSDYTSSGTRATASDVLGCARLLYVHPEYRREGAAKELMRCLVDHLIGEGCTYLTLSLNGNLPEFEARHHFATVTCGLVEEGDRIFGGPIANVGNLLAQSTTTSVSTNVADNASLSEGVDNADNEHSA